MLNFLLENWSSVVVILIVIAGLIVLYIRGEKKIFFYILYKLCTEAERALGSKVGELKKATVISEFYKIIPKIITVFLTEKMLLKLLEDALTYAKKTWAENAAIEGYVKGNDIIPTVAGANKE